MGAWKGMTTITRSPEGGTVLHSNIDITPDRFGAKLLLALLGGSIRKGFVKHENKHFDEFEAAMAGKWAGRRGGAGSSATAAPRLAGAQVQITHFRSKVDD